MWFSSFDGQITKKLASSSIHTYINRVVQTGGGGKCGGGGAIIYPHRGDF